MRENACSLFATIGDDAVQTVDRDTKEAGAQFIRRIKDGTLSKKILLNSSDDYPRRYQTVEGFSFN